MRLVFFTESLFPLVDGVSHTLAHLFQTLEREGVEFRIYAPFLPPHEISWSGRVRRVRSFSFPLYRDYRVSVPGGRKLAAELDAYRPDLVHVVSPTPMAVWAQHYARSRSIPVTATFHTHFVSYFPYYGARGLEPLGWRMIRWFYNRCHATWAPSSSIVEELKEHGVERVRLWSRGVDSVKFAPSWRSAEIRRLVGAGPDAPMLLLVSRLVKEKDLADLVGMDAELRRRGRSYRLALVGDGPMRRKLERKLPHAFFAGSQRGERLSQWYASGDIFVFPSTTETFANVVQEAMASGLPAVVVDRGGPQGVIEPGRSGLVARAKDPVHLADQVEYLLESPERRAAMGRAARQRAAGRSWDAVNAGLLADLRQVVRPASGSEMVPARRLA
jgi:phosphatidylinositol alpha 1,6-mannosyltransferase